MKMKLKKLWLFIQIICGIILMNYSLYVGLIKHDFTKGCYFMSIVILLAVITIGITQEKQ